MSTDPRYQAPVAGMQGDELATALQKSIMDVEANFPPNTGICVFVFDFGGNPEKGMGYIANAQRAEMVKALREWLNNQARRS